MEKLLAQQAVNQIELESFISNLKKTPKVRRNEGNLKKQMEVLEDLWVTIKTTNRQLLESYKKDEHAELQYFKQDVFMSLQESYFNAHGVLYEFLKAVLPSTETTNTQGRVNPVIVQERENNDLPLPRINIPSFSGGYQNWISFRDLFEGLIHNNRSLSNVQKLHYLQSSLSGEAKQVIRHLQLSEANYDCAWNLLKRRYHNERALVSSQLLMLTSLPTQHIETATNIKKFLDSINECLEGLKALKIDISTWDPILVHLLTQKLNRDTVAQWELALSNRINPTELPTITEFTEFLESRFRTLDAISRTKSHQLPKDNVKSNHHSAPGQLYTQSFITNTFNLCPVCNQDHRLKQCNKFLSMLPKTRYEFIRNNNRCINCFSKSHSVKECPNNMNCQHCKRRHNSLLHFNAQSKENRNMQLTQPHQTGKSMPQNAFRTNNNYVRQNRTQIRTHHISQENSTLRNDAPDFPRNLSEQQGTHLTMQPQLHNTNNMISPIATNSLFCSNQCEIPIQNQFANKNQNIAVLLATACVKITSPKCGTHLIRVLLDQGSQASFITEDTVQRLRLPKLPVRATVSGICDSQGKSSRSLVNCDIQSCYHTDFKTTVNAYVLPKITGILPNEFIEHETLNYLENLELADPQFLNPAHVDMLLGADIFAEILLDGVIKGPHGYPIAQHTAFGWIISGKIPSRSCNKHSPTNVSLSCNTVEIFELEGLLRKFWEIEELPIRTILKPEEIQCEEIFSSSHHRCPDGRYVVPLLFKDNTFPDLGDSRNSAKRRLLQMESRFAQNPKLLEDYKIFMNEYISLGHMEKIDTYRYNDTNDVEDEYFLPHHAVFKESSSTTKLRVVFDGSSKTTNRNSLNDSLLPGPPLQQDLYSILLRWRKYPIVFTADIEKMYRQILITPQHTRYQKILWRDDPNKPIDIYKLLTVTYGTSCAPYLALRTLQQLHKDEMHNYPTAAQKLQSDFYVDDVLTGAYSLEDAISLQAELRQLLKSGGFNLRKWTSNCETLVSHIPIEDRECAVPFPIEFANTVKTLGIHWNPKIDTFGFKVSLESKRTPVTKRSLLSDASRLFDPLGWLAPTVIVAKLMFQKLWIDGVNWDDQLSSILQTQWLQFRDELSQLEFITIPRYIEYRETSMIELHGFCDASTSAYAAVVYSRCISNDGKICTMLLTAKTKVAPIKQISVPRLELCGAYLLSKLITKVKNSMQISNITTFGWTDSLNVLAWLRGHPRQWQTFVANRVSEIQESKSVQCWNYVKSQDNPADCASRGVSPKDLMQHPLWWTGPSWLLKPQPQWPINNINLDTELERKKTVLVSVTINDNLLPIIERFSKLHRLIRVLTYCFRFYNNLRTKKENRKFTEITVKELIETKRRLESLVQQVCFSEEIQALQNKRLLPKSSKLYRLNPFIDEKGLLRLGGRLENSTLAFNKKFPIILPEKHYYTQLICNDCHVRSLHGGTQLTLNLLRNDYWIINARNVVRLLIHKCVNCFRYKASIQQQLMGPLPRPRVEQNRPFLHTGVDFSGYITIKESKCRGRSKTSKGYVSVFVCLSTKAIHLEFVSDLSSDAFLAALRRFTSRRGLCSDIYSDCGTNFVGASKHLIKAKLKSEYGLSSDTIQALSQYGIQWHFIPPASPHFGGLWEAGVKSVKYHLKRIIGDSLMTFEEMTTLLSQVEACLNSRPLCALTNDPDDFNALTPGHFLTGDTLLAIPEPNLLDCKTSALTRWHKLQRMVQDFWKRWLAEYLPRLQNRPKWHQPKDNVKIGNLVLIKDERMPPSKWLLARVIDLHPGKDNLVRVVTLKTKDGIFKRPISKICLLPIIDNNVS